MAMRKTKSEFRKIWAYQNSWACIELNNIFENLNCKHIVLNVFDSFYSATEIVKNFLTIDDCMVMIWYRHFYVHPNQGV